MTKKNEFENDNYEVKVVEGMYHIINKYTGVVERKDEVYPSAVEAAKFFDESIKKLEAESTKAPVVQLSH